MKPKTPTTPGTPVEGGFYAGRINVNGTVYGIILPPKATSEHAPTIWNESLKLVKGATSWCDGLANTKAMAKAGSKLAQWALDNKMHIPSVDELELLYRAFKPGTDTNILYGRSGINVSAVPPTYPYAANDPKQTKLKAFRAGGAEAFELAWYWSSTQHAAVSDYAWVQDFGNGYQARYHKSGDNRARAVRRIKI